MEDSVRQESAERKGGTDAVLVVEDDAAVADLIRDILAEAGFSALLTQSGTEALALPELGEVAIVLFDYTMPDMDGPDFYRRLRERGVTAPAILCSGWGDTEQRAMEMGVPFVRKPFDVDEFIRVVNEASCNGY